MVADAVMKYQDTAVNGSHNSADSGADLTCIKCEQRGSVVFSGKNKNDITLLLSDTKYCPTSEKGVLKGRSLRPCSGARSSKGAEPLGLWPLSGIGHLLNSEWPSEHVSRKITFGTQNAVLWPAQQPI